jgi:hypothetical protein
MFESGCKQKSRMHTRMQNATCRRPSSACTVCASSEALRNASSVSDSCFCVSLSNFDKRSTPLSLWSPWRRGGVGGGPGAALSADACRALPGRVATGMGGGGGGGLLAVFSQGAPGLGLRESAVAPERLRELSMWIAPGSPGEVLSPQPAPTVEQTRLAFASAALVLACSWQAQRCAFFKS